MYRRIRAFVLKYPRALAVLAVALVLGGGVLLIQEFGFFGIGEGSYPEVAELSAQPRTFQEYSTYFQQLADKKGAVYAYQILARAQLAPNTDLHLLGHIVGDMLYKQKGISGITDCTQDFRNACSHSVVIGVLNDSGTAALPDIADTCKKAPGGPGAYTMCFHGLGHGVLAYTGYDLQKAVEMCKLVGTKEYRNREYIECVGGTVMEMIAGVHDRQAWELQVDRFFSKSDPLYPCDADWMPQEVRPICYLQLTPHLFTSAGGNLGNLDPVIYPKAFSYCAALPESEDLTSDRLSCYGGFGKEFIVLAQERDVRDIGSMQEPALRNVRTWCAMADDVQGEIACNTSALASLFWGGENKPDASFIFCALAEGEQRDICYTQLAQNISYYHARDGQAPALCQRLPAEFGEYCRPKP